MRLSKRLAALPPYHFAAIAKQIADMKAKGIDVITFGMGDPDLPTAPEVLEELFAASKVPVNQRYPEYQGIPELRQEFTKWFEKRFHVTLDPDAETLVLIGSKEGLGHLPLAVLDPGDIALVPDPAFPIFSTAITMAGAECYKLPLLEENGFLPDLDSVPADVLAKAKLLWVNYPNNPTGACAPREFLEKAVRFAQKHDLVLLQDMAYSEVCFDGYRPSSILEIPGAKDVAVELHSFSKAFNMAGFRIGMLVGNAEIIKATLQVKSNIDTGVFRPIQRAAIRALHLPQEWIDERNKIYQRRRDIIVKTCNEMGLVCSAPKAGLYVWAGIPQGQTSKEFCRWLLDTAGVVVTPGTNFGPAGEGYIRISFTVPDDRIEQGLQRIKQALTSRAGVTAR